MPHSLLIPTASGGIDAYEAKDLAAAATGRILSWQSDKTGAKWECLPFGYRFRLNAGRSGRQVKQ